MSCQAGVDVCAKHRQHRGIALVVVLWMIMIMMTMAGTLIYSVRTQSQMVDYSRTNAYGRAMADAATHFAVMQLFMPIEQRSIKIGGTPLEWEYQGGKAEIRIIGENGLVDLNAANRALLQEVLTQVNVMNEDAEALLDAIEDFRDKDDLKRLNGAEDKDYENEEYEHGAKDAPFDRIEELQQVMGVTPTIYKNLLRYLTVSSQGSGINPMVAPRKTLLILAKGDEAAVDAYMAERDDAEGGWVQPPFGDEFVDQMQMPAYRIQVLASFEEGAPTYFEERSITLLPGRTPPFVTTLRTTLSRSESF